MMGDYNINFLKTEGHTRTAQFVDIILSYNYVPVTSKATRVTHRTATLIDNFLTNSTAHMNTIQGKMVSDTSDHLPIVYVQLTETAVRTPKVINERIYNDQALLQKKTRR